ncbi:MAG TPA: GMC family oxidoreductase N-terminal domain-containing protein [Burkholderiaceae bacterium]|nr:GMC family oxidoreductase N-terminal domain-containing protein [Burkholderiaceae bacterium]
MDNWDTIIIGAGSAGCVLANRLSADPAHRVLLLEAGGSDRRLWVRLPIGYARTFRDPAVNWMYQTAPDAALHGRSSYWPRGKVLGGSGSINAMAYVRGLPQDFDDWQARGNPGWGWDDVKPFFFRAEDHADGASPHHGNGGPLHVTRIDDRVHPLCAHFLAAADELGFSRNRDFNGPSLQGVGVYPITTRGGWRESTASAYLRPALHRGNLGLQLHAHATRVLMLDRRAIGVEYRHDGQLLQLQARRQVILCGGAVNSPQLLQLSGIGDAALLAHHGITACVDLPRVGQGLQDHLHITHAYRARVPTLNDMLGTWSGKLRAAMQFALSRGGPLAMSVNQAGGFVSVEGDPRTPQLQLYFNPASYSTRHGGLQRMMNPDPFPGFSMSVNSCRPTSRGNIAIASGDSMEPPRIVPNYLSTPHDVRLALAGARLLRRLAGTDALRAIIASEIRPGASCASDEDLLGDLRARADTIFHPVGTCAMGPAPASAVVDSRLRVFGVQGLRVVDASVFPSITSANTQAPTIMVAEKAAAMIAQDMRHA